MTQPVVLLIDAGFQACGIVIAQGRKVLHVETVRTERTGAKRAVRVADDDTERCRTLARALLRVIDTYKPAGAVVEMPHGGAQGARANRAMGMATGVVAAILEATGLPVEVVIPAQVKQAATGRKDASKGAVEAAVVAAYDWGDHLPSTKAEREHVCDAAAAGLAAEHGTLMRALARAAAVAERSA